MALVLLAWLARAHVTDNTGAPEVPNLPRRTRQLGEACTRRHLWLAMGGGPPLFPAGDKQFAFRYFHSG
jgi:hypothetical protein